MHIHIYLYYYYCVFFFSSNMPRQTTMQTTLYTHIVHASMSINHTYIYLCIYVFFSTIFFLSYFFNSFPCTVERKSYSETNKMCSLSVLLVRIYSTTFAFRNRKTTKQQARINIYAHTSTPTHTHTGYKHISSGPFNNEIFSSYELLNIMMTSHIRVLPYTIYSIRCIHNQNIKRTYNIIVVKNIIRSFYAHIPI